MSCPEPRKIGLVGKIQRPDTPHRRSHRWIFGALVGLCLPGQVVAAPSEAGDLPQEAGLSGLGDRPLLNQTRKLRGLCEAEDLWRLTPGISDLPASPPARDRFEACLTAVDAFNLWLEVAPLPTISDKEAATFDLMALLTFVQEKNGAIREMALRQTPLYRGPRLAEGVALEHSIRRGLARLNLYESWEGAVDVRAGALRTRSGSRATAGLRASIRLDLGARLDGQAEVETGTPRKEGGGQIAMPPKSSDLVYLSQLWVRSRQIPRFHLWLGVRPDENDPAAPERWPFFSLGSKAFLVERTLWAVDMGIRHDKYGLWDATTDISGITEVERNQTFVSSRWTLLRDLNLSLQLNLRAAMNWFSDPKGVLRRLSLGRYDDVQPTFDRPDQYRIVKFDAGARLRLGPHLLIEPYLAGLWNLEAREDRDGRIAMMNGRIQLDAWRVTAGVHHALIRCDAAPPAALARYLFPGQRVDGGSLGLSLAMNKTLALDGQVLAQRAAPIPSARECPWGPGSTADDHRTSLAASLGLLVTLGPPAATGAGEPESLRQPNP